MLSKKAEKDTYLKTQDLVALVNCFVILLEPKFDCSYVENTWNLDCSHPGEIISILSTTQVVEAYPDMVCPDKAQLTVFPHRHPSGP